MIPGWTGPRSSSLARVFRLVEPLLRFLAKRARRKGINIELEARYRQGDDERRVHAQRA